MVMQAFLFSLSKMGNCSAMNVCTIVKLFLVIRKKMGLAIYLKRVVGFG